MLLQVIMVSDLNRLVHFMFRDCKVLVFSLRWFKLTIFQRRVSHKISNNFTLLMKRLSLFSVGFQRKTFINFEKSFYFFHLSVWLLPAKIRIVEVWVDLIISRFFIFHRIIIIKMISINIQLYLKALKILKLKLKVKNRKSYFYYDYSSIKTYKKHKLFKIITESNIYFIIIIFFL